MPPIAPAPGNSGSKLMAVGYMALGVGMFIMGAKMWQALAVGVAAAAGGRALSGGAPGSLGYSTGEESLVDATRRVTSMPKAVAQHHTVRSIEQRLKLISQLVHKGSRDPEIRSLALGVVSRKCGAEWCVPERGWKAEADAIYRALTDPTSEHAIRYTSEHRSVDIYNSARRTLALRAGDCDDMTIVMASMLIALGHEVRLIVIQSVGAKDWSHIFLALVPPQGASDGLNLAGGGSGWYFLDPTMRAHGPGWEPPGTSVCLKTGRPAGMVVKAKAFHVK